MPQPFGSGQIDYKGLDIDKFIPGSQVYAHDVTECVIATSEDYNGENPDVIELTQEEYELKAEELRATHPEPEVNTEYLQQQIDALNIAMAGILGGGE